MMILAFIGGALVGAVCMAFYMVEADPPPGWKPSGPPKVG
jgi:hypothetical protein